MKQGISFQPSHLIQHITVQSGEDVNTLFEDLRMRKTEGADLVR